MEEISRVGIYIECGMPGGSYNNSLEVYLEELLKK